MACGYTTSRAPSTHEPLSHPPYHPLRVDLRTTPGESDHTTNARGIAEVHSGVQSPWPASCDTCSLPPVFDTLLPACALERLSHPFVLSLAFVSVLCCSSSIPLHPQGDTEKLAIFGRTRGRRGAELKVMAAVETKVPGYFTERMVVPEDDKDGFGTRTLVLKVRAS